MATCAHNPSPWLSELEAPLLDLSGSETAQVLLDRLKTQNTALERLLQELAIEDGLASRNFCAVDGR